MRLFPRASAKGVWGRASAMIIKELLQLRRTASPSRPCIMIPLVQLLLFGYAINTTPRNLPTAVLMQETSDVGRSSWAALENTKYFKIVRRVKTEAEFDRLLAAGDVLFAVEIPAEFERALRAATVPPCLWRPMRPIRLPRAPPWRRWRRSRGRRCKRPRHSRTVPALFEIRQHARYNPAAVTQLNIVPGLLGTILTMTMLIYTALSVTREVERGTMESLLAMPISPLEIMLGKIAPYILVGFMQAILIFSAGVGLFGVPVMGNLAVLAALTTLFIATNLSIGYTFSTLAGNQLQAVQMSIMFFLPNILMSGFAFPFAGMPAGRNGSASACRSRITSGSCAAFCSKAPPSATFARIAYGLQD